MQNIFGFIIHPMEVGVVWLTVAVGNAGIGIILFTILVRLVLAPLLITQLRNAKAMQRLQPHIAELKKKHGKDRQALSTATMALYKEHRVNPALGCLPTLLQFPVLIGLFYALLHLGMSPSGWPKHANYANTVCNGFQIHNLAQWQAHCYAITQSAGTASRVFDLFHANFLWLSNGLGSPDPLFILPILAGVTQWVQSRMMLTRSVDPQQQMMNNMMNFVPLMIVFFATRYPSGLSLYWVSSTLIGIAVQYRITGLGLLPETLGNIAARLGSANALGTGRMPGSTTGSSSRPLKPSRLTDRSNGSSSPNGKGLTTPTPDIDLNANGGDGSEPPASEIIRPRKQANRARGGRRGGRRG